MGRKRIASQTEVLRAISKWIIDKGMPPTFEDLKGVLGVKSKRTVYDYVNELVKAKAIERWDGARGIKVLRSSEEGETTVEVCLLGTVPAGRPMAAEENVEARVRLPKALLVPRGSRFFLLRVVGNSMNEAEVAGVTIEEDDLLLVQQKATAGPNDIVVAIIDGEATVKKLVKGSDYWVLKPVSSNKEHRPIFVGENTQIQGIVRRVFKKGAELLRG